MSRAATSTLPLLLFACVCSAQTLMIGDWPPPVSAVRPVPPPPEVPPDTWAALQVVSQHVRVAIGDQVATTTVEQVFHNHTGRRIEAWFMFPVPSDTHIEKFSMDVNGQQQQAELLDADKARKIYEDIVRAARDPALLEYCGQKLLRLRIFPIEPHSDKKIVFTYSQLLKSDAGLIGYTFPLGVHKHAPGRVRQMSVRVEVESSRPLANIYSPSHAVEIKRHSPRKVVIGFETQDARPESDFQLYFAHEPDNKDGVALSLLAFRDRDDGGDPDGYFLLLASPGAARHPRQVVPRDVVFVIDTSGSMAGAKLEQAQRALRFCIANLNREDRFDVIRFSTEAEPLFGTLRLADHENRASALRFIDGFKPIGGTAIEDAFRVTGKVLDSGDDGQARPAVVIFLTDGRPTIGNTDEDSIVAGLGRLSGARVFCFGIGNDVNTHLLDKITEKTRAVSRYVLPEEDIEVKVSSFYSKISNPVLTDLKLTFDGPVKVSRRYPSDLPDLFEGDQLVLVGRYRGVGDVVIRLEGDCGGRQRAVVYEATFGKRAGPHEFVARLWATRRVGHLLDEIRLHGEHSELRDEVTRLARRFGIVTPYTSYLIVEDEARRNVPAMSRTMQELDAPGRRAELAGAYRRLRDEKTGDGAVGAAQANLALKDALQPTTAPVFANAHALRAGEKPVTQQQVKVLRNRAFYLNGDEWIDAEVAYAPQARRVEVRLGSPEYFALVAADAAAWFSAGRKMQVLINDTVYLVR